jgi:hypothetical protein
MAVATAASTVATTVGVVTRKYGHVCRSLPMPSRRVVAIPRSSSWWPVVK